MANKKKAAALVAPLAGDLLANATDLYIRVSTTEQAEEGFSVEEQEARLRSYCDAYGLIINAVHSTPALRWIGPVLRRSSQT